MGYTIEELEKALCDILDGEDEWGLESYTGLPAARCKEIFELYIKIKEK